MIVPIILAALVASLAVNGGPAQQPAHKCDSTLWAHVYLPTRLHVLKPCVSVTGVIKSVHPELDGDLHIHLKTVDKKWINQANIKFENGDLILEVICQHTPTQKDVGNSCTNFNHPVNIPHVGTHVVVVGSWVNDTRHHNWNEIHPVTSIIVGG